MFQPGADCGCRKRWRRGRNSLEEPEHKGMDPKLFVDESLVREVEVSGFIKALYHN